jgi:hypothetical protein
MKKPNETETAFGQFAGRPLDALALWADANQRIFQELAEFSANAVKEGFHLYAELQAAGFEAMKEGQNYWFRRLSELGDLPKDPIGWYQKSMGEGMEVTQKTLTSLMDTDVQTMERLQASAQQTTKEIQQTFATLTDKMQAFSKPSEP